jgi:RNA polymerase primary sigma factor
MKNGKNGSKPGQASSSDQPVLTREEEYELFERIKKGDKRAENIIVSAHYGFVCDMASNYSGLDRDDLVQEGFLGMLVAIQKFDHKKGIRFITYSGYWVRAYMTVAVIRRYKSRRSPGARYVVMREIKKQSRLYVNLHGRYLRIEELSEMLGMRESTIVRALNGDKMMPSIGIARDDDDPLGWQYNQEVIPDTKTPGPLDLIEDREKMELITSVEKELRRVLKKKPNYKRNINITLAHLIDGVNAAELGRRHNLSRERVRQINLRSVKILRRILIRRKSEFSDLLTHL